MSRKLLSLSVTAALLGGTAMADAPRVAADITPIHSLVARVMEGVGTPDLIVQQGASPHGYSLRPSEADALQNADVVVWMGAELSPWMVDAVETLAADASVLTLLEADGTMLLDFREGALFEAHSHDHGDDHAHDDHDHDHDHGEEHAHDDHDHDHGHGDHAFEWGGLFELEVGTYSWSFAKVGGDYADPAMRMVILSADDIEAAEETAEELLEAEAAEERLDGEVLVAADTAYSLVFDADQDMTVFEVSITEAGSYAFFTEHMPFEFEADEHFFKDATGADVEPVAQEPDMDHDHGHDDHAHDDHGHDDHSGHDHGEHDPHAWLSPTNAAAWLNLIAAELSAVDPDNAGTYFANAAAAREELEALSVEVNEILEPARGLSFIVFHDAYQYFEMDFDFPASGAISLGDATDPSPARVAEIQGRVQDEGVTCVLSEPQFNPGLVTTVLDGTDANTTVIDPLGFDLELGASLYPQLIRNLATSLAECG